MIQFDEHTISTIRPYYPLLVGGFYLTLTKPLLGHWVSKNKDFPLLNGV